MIDDIYAFHCCLAAQDRREMLEEIMRKGTSSLGTDVPSEREINRLAARSDEEFWLFEKMDEDRRRKESYRSRLMEEHEVPDWAYAAPETNERKGKGFQYDAANITGKRRRKEVVYADTYSDIEWAKAAENGDLAKHSTKGKKRRVHISTPNNDLPNNSAGGEKKVQDLMKNETVPVATETIRTNTFGSTSTPRRLKSEDTISPNIEFSDRKDGSLDGLTWKAHKKKRSSLVINP